MTKTSTTITLASLVVSLAYAPFAAAAPPRAGSNSLRIEGSYLIPGVQVIGVNHQSKRSGGMTSDTTVFGAGFAYGRFLTDYLEAGSSVTVLRVNGSGGSATWGYGAAPFLRGFALVTDRLALYGGPVGGIQFTNAVSGDATEFNVGADAGAEFFVGDSWSLRIGPGYRYVRQSVSTNAGSGTTTGNVYGVNWALAGYF